MATYPLTGSTLRSSISTSLSTQILIKVDNETVGAFLFVDAQIESHQISGDAQSVIILENATMQFTKVYPIALTGQVG